MQWSTKYHDGTAPSEFKMMSPEDRQFLENAMEEAFGQMEDNNKIMQEAINQIKAADRNDALIMTALEVIDKCCDDVDCARNVEKFDGVQTILDLVASGDQQVRSRSLEILALLFSNNPNIQEAGIRRGAMQTLQTVLRSSPVGSEDRSKTLRALVALVRGVQALEESLLSNGGADDTVACLARAEDKRTREKAAAFANSMAANARLSAEDAARFAAAIAPLLSDVEPDASIQYREVLAASANSLVRLCPSSTKEAALLRDAASARLAALPAQSDEDAEQERQSLEDCVKAD
jgi:hypothetical protein